MDLKELVQEIIAIYWLIKNPHCGLSSHHIAEKLKDRDIEVSEDEIKEILHELTAEGDLSTRIIEGGDRVTFAWKDNQFTETIEPGPHNDLWVYPKQTLLEKYDTSKIEHVGMYKKQLNLGGSQIEHRFFERQVLDRYREDPRYRFEEWGSSGYIGIEDEFFLDDSVPEEDKFTIQSFGYGYNAGGEQVVAVILSYLGNLSVKHQNYWNSFECGEKCKLDADYVETNFEANFTDRVSIYRAFCHELDEINKICDLMEEPKLFRDAYIDERPPTFGKITKPTEGDYYDFISILDKFISENLNRKFFKGKVELTHKETSKKGETRVIDKGTLRLLEEYLDTYWKFPDSGPRDEMVQVFKHIRSERRKPAHEIQRDRYDEKLFQTQKDLMISAYRAIRTLRLILRNHPKAISYVAPKWLNEGRIL